MTGDAIKHPPSWKRRVNIYRWRNPASRHGNFGDEIISLILERLFGLEAVPVPMSQAELLGSGSILDHYWIAQRSTLYEAAGDDICRRRNASDLHVWGSGFILENSKLEWPQRVYLHAVRGALTAGRLTATDIQLGDPGILASALMDNQPKKSLQVCLVPHYTDFPWVASCVQSELPGNWSVADPEQPVEKVLRRIAASELVIASSLHGLIVADSFGIPCVWVSTNTPLYGDTVFKFRDYESSRGTPLNQPLRWGAAIGRSQADLAATATRPARSVAEWQEALLSVFPFR